MGFNCKWNLDTRVAFESLQDAERMILSCGGTKEKQHYEREGKLYGIIPFGHCDTDCL